MKDYDELSDRLYVLALMMAENSADGSHGHELLQAHFDEVNAELTEWYAEMTRNEFHDLLEQL